MATVRIYKVAELLGTTSQEVIELLNKEHGIVVKSASSTIEEVVARQFVERLARERNLPLPNRKAFTDTAPAAKGKRSAKAEPAKPAAQKLPPPRLIKSAKAQKEHEDVEAPAEDAAAPAPAEALAEEPEVAAPAAEPVPPAAEAPAAVEPAPAAAPPAEARRGPGRRASRRAGRAGGSRRAGGTAEPAAQRRGGRGRAAPAEETAAPAETPAPPPAPPAPGRPRRCRSRRAAWCRPRCGCASRIRRPASRWRR